MKNPNVLISGASIAGPALAYWLRRYGFSPTVVERAPALRDGGHAIDLRGVAKKVVERMGLMDDVRRASIDTRGMSFVDGANSRLADMPAELLGGNALVAEIEILRGDLSQVLYDAAGDVEYLFDDRITELSDGEDGVKATFERAAPRSFDLVVGADGVHSGVRSLVFGPEERLVRHLGEYSAFFTLPDHLGLDHWERFHNVPGRKVVAMRPARKPGEAKALFSFASPPLRYDRGDVAAQKRVLAEVFADVGWEAPRMLEAMWQAPDFYLDADSRVELDAWSSGRTVLLGDAGYAGSAGQGTSMALVGAYVLAGELSAAGGDHLTAYARYEEVMRPYVAACRKGGGSGWFMPRSRAGIWLRNQNLRALPYLPWKGLIAKALQKDDVITLKDY